ncbi:MAG: BolA/IbaG family iron-sulfur metabolism protein [Endozoicomonadaceae bacterium]|nr:BolA/IbaG family iron-sulfur metabolism protein [Endozoicomonadaceae bacterium]
MQAVEVKMRLEERLGDAEIIVSGEGCDFQLTVISDQFSGVLPVKRQQMVYVHLNDLITDGSIHAVSMSTFTRDEWIAQQ